MAQKSLANHECNKGAFGSILAFYIQGLKSMRLGKTLWKIIAIKLFIIFFVFKLFFFPDMLDRFFETDQDKADHVSSVLTSSLNPASVNNFNKISELRR